MVGAIKPLIEEKGVFDQIGITELERQRQGFLNLFQAISKLYGEKWNDRSNAFLYAAGFTGAIEFLKNRIVPYCTTKKSFKSEVILDALKSLAANLVAQSEIKGLGGKDAPKRIYERLNAAFEPNQDVPSQLEI